MSSVTDVVRRAVLEALQLDPAPYTSHSLRADFVTGARAHGVPDELIVRHTRHARAGQRRGGILHVYDRPTRPPRAPHARQQLVVTVPERDRRRRGVPAPAEFSS